MQAISTKELQSFPAELINIDKWVLWKLEKVMDKKTGQQKINKLTGKPEFTKVPYQINGWKATSTNPETWTSYEAVLKHSHKYSGVGFVLTSEDPYTVIDLDDCIENGVIRPEAKILVDALDSYTEYSQSKTGLHIFINAKKPGERSKNTSKDVEIYDDKRFIVMTGNHVKGTPTEIHERQMILDYIYESYFSEPEKKQYEIRKSELDPSPILSDDEVLKIAFRAKNGESCKKLYNGDFIGYESQSEADLAFCNNLAFYTQDAEQIDRIFINSGLYRGKWDRKDYKAWTIQTAIDGLNATYQRKDIQLIVNQSVKDSPDTNPTRGLDDEFDKKLERNEKGAIISNSRNAETILTNEPFKGVLAYDAFKNVEAIKGDLPWRSRERLQESYEPWLGSDDKRLFHYFGKVYDFKPTKTIENAYMEVTRKNAFHPVKDYLEAITWDGIPRVETFFIDYLGAEDTPYIRAVTRKWLTAAVTRIYEPGCKFDYMPVLVGEQGVGKSSLIAKLAREWFSDSLKNLDNKEAGEHLQSSWIFEFGELAAMRKTEVEEIKAFITKQTDSYRVAYDRVISDFPRKCVFIGTTNRSDFLRDQTGNRRFWAIATNHKNRKYEVKDLTDSMVGQVWAEAMNLYKQGENLYLDSELEEEAHKIQESHMEVDPRTGMIEEYLNKFLPVEWGDMKIYERVNFLAIDSGSSRHEGVRKRERVCAAEIWTECLGNDHKNMRPFEASAIYDILRKIGGWEERKPARTTFKHYGKQTTFIRNT